MTVKRLADFDNFDEWYESLSPEIRATWKRGSEIEPPTYATWEEELEARMR